MRSWHRATFRMRCGYDHACWIPEHEVYCLISGEHWKKIRCAAHAGDPPAREAVPQFKAAPLEASGFSSVGSLARSVPRLRVVADRFDARQAQAGYEKD